MKHKFRSYQLAINILPRENFYFKANVSLSSCLNGWHVSIPEEVRFLIFLCKHHYN